MKNLENHIPTFKVNCILTPLYGSQIFVNLDIPLEYGEKAVRMFFLGYATANKIKLAKASMCVYDANKQHFDESQSNLTWYAKAGGKLYFNRRLFV